MNPSQLLTAGAGSAGGLKIGTAIATIVNVEAGINQAIQGSVTDLIVSASIPGVAFLALAAHAGLQLLVARLRRIDLDHDGQPDLTAEQLAALQQLGEAANRNGGGAS
jgi:hypothetical protein